MNPKQISNEIDNRLRRESMEAKKKRIYHKTAVILGPGDSGKSTIVRQMSILSGKAITEEERAEFVRIIRSRFLRNLCIFIKSIKPNQEQECPVTKCIKKLLFDIQRSGVCNPTPEDIKMIFKSQIMHDNFTAISRQGHLDDSFLYFTERYEKICDINYIPTEDDILRARNPTSSVKEIQLAIGEKTTLHLYDVAGQKDKRQRWAAYFDQNTDAIIYVASLACFDQMLEEDTSINRFYDSVVLFDKIINNPLLEHIPIILLLNKVDLLREKLKKMTFASFISNYIGKNEVSDIKKHCVSAFESQNKNPERSFNSFFTTALDKKLMEKVRTSVM